MTTLSERKIKSFWKGKTHICKKCKTPNMDYWVKLNKVCGNCNHKFGEDLIK